MKVLHVIPSVATIRGGPSQAIIEMVQELKKQELDVSIITTNDNGVSVLDVPTNDWIIYHGVSIRFFPRFSPPISSIREFVFSSDLTCWLWKNIREYDFLHIHGVFSYPSTIAMTIAELLNVPYIVRPGGHLCNWALKQNSFKKNVYLKIIALHNINYSKGIHFTTNQELLEAQELKITIPKFVVPHGISGLQPIDDSRSRLRQMLSIPHDEIVILFMSRIHPKKGLEYLIQALSQLNNQKFIFVIAGSGEAEYESYIKNLIQEQNLSSKTKFMGFIEGDIKNLVLQGSDLFTLTSFSENFGVAVLEALISGLPVLITDGVALKEIVLKHDLGCVSPMNVEAIRSSLLQFFAAPNLFAQKGLKAKEIIKNEYSWQSVANQLINIYEKTCSVNEF